MNLELALLAIWSNSNASAGNSNHMKNLVEDVVGLCHRIVAVLGVPECSWRLAWTLIFWAVSASVN